MKIAVLGYAGSGKSTLARALGDYYGLPVLHLDTVMFLPGWRERPQEEQLALVRDFMDRHEGWVIDGNYSNLLQPRRLAEADLVVMLLFGRFSSLARVTKRYRRFRGQSRPDMAAGCEEKLDAAFIRWVLWEGRSRKKREGFERKRKSCGDRCVVLKNQRQIDRFLKEIRENGYNKSERTP